MTGTIDLDRVRQAAGILPPEIRDTPQFVSDALTDRLDLTLVVKVECLNPIRSFKGRGCDWLLESRPDLGDVLVTASAGNFGQGLQWAARRRGRRTVVFAATRASPVKVQRMRELGATVHLVGDDFDAAKDAARVHASEHGLPFVEDGDDPAIAEGAATIALELGRMREPLDAVLVPVGNGSLMSGVGGWMKAHHPATRRIGVVAANAPSMLRSFEEGRPVTTAHADTLADGIAVRVPVPPAVTAVNQVTDEMVAVQESTLLEAMRILHEDLGLVVEGAGAASLAGLLEQRERWQGRRVAVLLCGGNLTPDQVRMWLGPGT